MTKTRDGTSGTSGAMTRWSCEFRVGDYWTIPRERFAGLVVAHLPDAETRTVSPIAHRYLARGGVWLAVVPPSRITDAIAQTATDGIVYWEHVFVWVNPPYVSDPRALYPNPPGWYAILPFSRANEFPSKRVRRVRQDVLMSGDLPDFLMRLSPRAPRTLLDLACRWGLWGVMAHRAGLYYYGNDISPVQVGIAQYRVGLLAGQTG